MGEETTGRGSAFRAWWRDPAEVARLKQEADLASLVCGHGVALKAEGADLVGLCPFHEEKSPSLRVTPGKGLWHCFGCGKGGSAVDWLVTTRGFSIRQAFDHLRVLSGRVDPGVRPDDSACAFPADAGASDEELLSAVVAYYGERLSASAAGEEYLRRRGLWDPALVARFQLGLSDRTLGPALERHAEGAEIRRRLQGLGVFRDNGREHLNGSLTVPIFGEDGAVEGLYGRKIGRGLRPGTPVHLYLQGPHRGVFNRGGVLASRSDTVVLCEALLDVLTLVRWGIEPVTSAYGVHGFLGELYLFLVSSGFRRVVLAFDADQAGERAAREIAPRLSAQGLEVQRMALPEGQDVNSFALACRDPADALRTALAQASWMSEPLYGECDWLSALPARAAGQVVEPPFPLAAAAPPPPQPPRAVRETRAPSPAPVRAAAPESVRQAEPLLPAPEPAQEPPRPAAAEGEDSAIDLVFGDRSWRVKGLWRNRGEALRVTLRAWRPGTGFHLDALDLYQAKSREAFARAAAAEIGAEVEVVRADLARLVLSLEERLEAARRPAPEPRRELSPEERAEALSLLERPDMLAQLLLDLEAAGLVGEEENKLLVWLALSSRRLESPLGVLIQSTSAAGKSSLLDGVLRTMPEEEVVRYSAMSGQALFYMGGMSLRHKVLCIAEEEGARRASYSLKLLQSDGALSMASTTKDAESGQLVTREYRTEGPVALALTTTSLSVDPELSNRCLVLSVDESREQTEAIHARQRQAQTRQGLLDRRGVEGRLSVWRNAQRLLQPLDVVNPFAEDLTLSARQTRSRRDMAKYLTLLRAVALAHQRQRPRRRDAHGEYIEVSLDDIELGNRLAGRALGAGQSELSGPTQRLLSTLRQWVQEEAVKQGIEPHLVRFTRRDLADCTPWSASQLKEHLRALVEAEHLAVWRGRNGLMGSVQYQLCEGEEAPTAGTTGVERLRERHPQAPYAGIWAAPTARPEPSRHPAGQSLRPGRVVGESARQPRLHAAFRAEGEAAQSAEGDPAGPAGDPHRESQPARVVAEASMADPVGAAA